MECLLLTKRLRCGWLRHNSNMWNFSFKYVNFLIYEYIFVSCTAPWLYWMDFMYLYFYSCQTHAISLIYWWANYNVICSDHIMFCMCNVSYMIECSRCVVCTKHYFNYNKNFANFFKCKISYVMVWLVEKWGPRLLLYIAKVGFSSLAEMCQIKVQ